MNKKDLHDVFIDELNRRFPKKFDLVNLISDILKIEREAVYRRLSGKVNFSVREIGILAATLNISIDALLHQNKSIKWLPLVLESPLKMNSMEIPFNMVETLLSNMKDLAGSGQAEMGGVYNHLPLLFYLHSPILRKFLFFKWGHYFIQTDEFNKFSEWELPEKIITLFLKREDYMNFQKRFCV